MRKQFWQFYAEVPEAKQQVVSNFQPIVLLWQVNIFQKNKLSSKVTKKYNM